MYSKEKKNVALIRMILESPGALLLAIGEHQTKYTNVLDLRIAACHRGLLEWAFLEAHHHPLPCHHSAPGHLVP